MNSSDWIRGRGQPLSRIQEFVTGSYPQPDNSNPYPETSFLQDISFPSAPRHSTLSPSISFSVPKTNVEMTYTITFASWNGVWFQNLCPIPLFKFMFYFNLNTFCIFTLYFIFSWCIVQLLYTVLTTCLIQLCHAPVLSVCLIQLCLSHIHTHIFSICLIQLRHTIVLSLRLIQFWYTYVSYICIIQLCHTSFLSIWPIQLGQASIHSPHIYSRLEATITKLYFENYGVILHMETMKFKRHGYGFSSAHTHMCPDSTHWRAKIISWKIVLSPPFTYLSAKHIHFNKNLN